MDVNPTRTDRSEPADALDARHPNGAAADGDAMVLRAEELRVRMVPEVTGRVTLRKRLVTQERTVVVTVQREELEVVEESADALGLGGPDAAGRDAEVDRAAAETARGAGVGAERGADAGELVLFEQRPVVTLEWVPVERVRVERTTVVEQQTFTDTVRREEAEVLQEGPDDAQGVGRSEGFERAEGLEAPWGGAGAERRV